MALGKKEQSKSSIIYVTLARGEDVGFKRYIGTGESRTVESYDHVTGVPSGFYMKPELIYEVAKDLRAKGMDPNKVDISAYPEDQLKYVATLLLKDPESGEMVGVNFDMHDSLGGKVIGMLNAAVANGAIGSDFHIRTFYAAPGTKYNDSTKGRSSINMRPNVEGAPDVKPLFYKAPGELLLDDKGEPGLLPMGEVAAVVKGKKIWEFSARNNVITETALVVADHFKGEHHTETPADDGVDLGEAAAAAAPKG